MLDGDQAGARHDKTPDLQRQIQKTGCTWHMVRREEAMQLTKEEAVWIVTVDESDNHLGLVNMLRYLDDFNTQIGQENIEGLVLELDLARLERANSELIAQFVMLQSTLVRSNGRLRIVNANIELKGAFDVVMLDKIISVQYQGLDEEEGSGEVEDE